MEETKRLNGGKTHFKKATSEDNSDEDDEEDSQHESLTHRPTSSFKSH